MASADRWARALAPGIRHHLLALTFFVVTFALIPFSIYAHSGEAWGFPFTQLLAVVALGLGLFVGAAVLLRLLAAVHAPSAATIAIALFCLGLFLLLAHVYAPIQIDPLDGEVIESAEPLLYSIIEVALLAGAVLAFVQLRHGRGLTVAALFSLALLLISFAYAGYLTTTDRPVAQAAAASPTIAPTANAAGIEGNVYHIVLDRMQTDAFLHALGQTDTAEVFRGFQLFENNLANYIRTPQSAASYFTGTHFDGGNYKRWINGWYHEDGLLPILAEHGYRLWMYAAMSHWDSKYLDIFQYNVDIYEQDTGWTGAGFYDLLHIWLASLAPNPLTNEALPLAGALADRTFELLTGRLRPLSGAEGLHPFASVVMLRRLAAEEQLRAPGGEYVYAHAVLPHGPLVLDRHCDFVGGKGRRAEPLDTVQEAFLVQAECSIELVAAFLRELQRLDRFDAATIVIHGDTGTWVPFGDGPGRRGRVLGYSRRSLVSYLQALLMIKRPQSEGPLELTTTPTQLVDLYPTLVDLLDLSPPAGSKVAGRSIFSTAAAGARDTHFAIPPKNERGRDLIQIRVEDPSDLRGSKLTVIGPVGDPTTGSP